jgi:hypothetical protein
VFTSSCYPITIVFDHVESAGAGALKQALHKAQSIFKGVNNVLLLYPQQ